MGSLKRQLRRKKEIKQQKEARKTTKQVEQQVSAMPKTCGVCNDIFDNTNKEMLNQWRIAVWDDGKVELTCPKCGPTPEEIEASNGARNENS